MENINCDISENSTQTAVIEEKVDTPPQENITEGESAEQPEIDYQSIIDADMQKISEELENGEKIGITDLKNPIRYGELRDMGLTAGEAYLASGGRICVKDNRLHLKSSVPRSLSSPFSEMPKTHLDMARNIFSDLSDAEIRNLYKKVTQ